MSQEKSTVELRQEKNKALIIEQLKKLPIVQVACEKVGIGRATYYRWRNDDQQFAKNCDDAMREGVELVSEMAESQLLSAIRAGNFSAIAFWLKNRHRAYTTKVEVLNKNEDEELSDEQKKVVKDALRMASLMPAGEKSNAEKQDS